MRSRISSNEIHKMPGTLVCIFLHVTLRCGAVENFFPGGRGSFMAVSAAGRPPADEGPAPRGKRAPLEGAAGGDPEARAYPVWLSACSGTKDTVR